MLKKWVKKVNGIWISHVYISFTWNVGGMWDTGIIYDKSELKMK